MEMTVAEKYDIALSFLLGVEEVDRIAEAQTRDEIESIMGNTLSKSKK